jgi:hypothetical protein
MMAIEPTAKDSHLQKVIKQMTVSGPKITFIFSKTKPLPPTKTSFFIFERKTAYLADF